MRVWQLPRFALIKGIKEPAPGGLGKDGEPPDNGIMEHRVTALETRLDTILPTLATKTDMADVRTEMHKGFSEMVRWIVGTAIAGIAIMLSILTFYSNTTNRPQGNSVQPIVIQLDGLGTSGGMAGARPVAPPAPPGK